MSNHSPLPWKHRADMSAVYDANGEYLLDVSDADAELIVAAVNAYRPDAQPTNTSHAVLAAELVETRKRLTEETESVYEIKTDHWGTTAMIAWEDDTVSGTHIHTISPPNTLGIRTVLADEDDKYRRQLRAA